MNNRFILFINTIKYLKPSQIAYRIAHKAVRGFYKLNLLKTNTSHSINTIDEQKLLVQVLDFDEEYLSRFDLSEILDNEFRFINIKYKVSLNTAWNNKNYQHLWRYNLHYFEYLYKLGYEYLNNNRDIKYYEKYRDLISNWINNNPCPYGDGWHSYTISLRIVNWMSTFEIFSDSIEEDVNFKTRMLESLYEQYSYLQKNLEKDVLGNHYFENIKAMLIGSIFFKEERIKSKFIKELMIQLREQILDDGMHFERTPMYHKIVLEDLIKIAVWLKMESSYEELYGYISRMLNVMYSLEEGFGKTPAFNDSADGISKSYQCLLDTCKDEFELIPKHIDSLNSSGYYIISKDHYKLIFDCGEICPTYLPAHGHCDALSYELSVRGRPILVNSGTYQYENGFWRDYFRQTKAHNTLRFGEKEQTQFWSSFRIAKRIINVTNGRFKYDNIDFYCGSYDTYFGSNHTRYIAAIDEEVILVFDVALSKTDSEVRSYIHMAPNSLAELGQSVVIRDEEINLTIKPILSGNVVLEKGWYSGVFNVKKENQHIVITKNKDSIYSGYLILLNNIDCKVQLIGDELMIRTDKEYRIDLGKLREYK